MNRLFIAIDGDDAGQKVGQAVLADDVAQLHEISSKINAANKAVEQMITFLGGTIISSGGDELSAMLEPQHENKIEAIRQKYQEASGFSATIGSGLTLSQAGKSLIAGKLTGKNKHVKYDLSVEDTLKEAHEAAQAGTADPEQQKMDDHYIDSTFQDEENQEFNPEDMMQNPEDQTFEDEAPAEDYDDAAQEEAFEGDEFDNAPEMSEEENFNPEMSEEESDFESEEPIVLDDSQMQSENEESDTEKADQDMEIPEGDPDALEDQFQDSDGKEEILQRIAANLDSFKQNKELMDQIKEAKPELYESILGLMHNMIELAGMITESDSQEDNLSEELPPEEAPVDEMSPSEAPFQDESLEDNQEMEDQDQAITNAAEEETPEEEENLPKQSGW